jgi:tetratricopeptide (TPR) repeat protein
MKSPETYLKTLRPDKLQRVIEDMQLRLAGYTLYYAIDPYEVYNFCFPLSTSVEAEIETFAADQAALYEICFKHKEKPLLVGRYVDELSGLMRYAADVVSKVYDEAEKVDALMLKGGVEDIPADALMLRGGGDGREANDGRDVAEAVQVISEKFHIVLAVAMGIYSLGAGRFRQVYRDLLTDGAGLPENRPGLQAHFKSYRETRLSTEILSEFMKTISGLSEIEFRKRRRSAFIDASVIDQLIHVNTSLLRGEAGPRPLILYLSSAHRTETAFAMPATKRRLPHLGGKQFDFHRDRDHIFYYVAYRSERGNMEETIENLERVKHSVEELNKLKGLSPFGSEYCSNCVLGGARPNHCEMLETCEHLKTLLAPLEQRSTEIRNLGLTQTLGRYGELMGAQPSGESQQKLMRFFRRVFEDQNLKDVATQKKLEKEKLVFLQSITAKMWSRSRSREAAAIEFLRKNRDDITGASQYLPLKPKVRSPKYAEIVNWVLSYFKTPPRGDAAKIAVIDGAYRLYLDQETVTTDLDPEHELVRCLLYLGLPSTENDKNATEGDRRAYEHATEMLELPGVLREMPDSEAEFRYIACWAARRLKMFVEANEQARAAIEKWPEDARFYHGRSLSKLAEWAKTGRAAGELRLLVEAEDDAINAITLYGREREENRELIGANYNNLAYLYTVRAEKASDGEEVPGHLAKARQALRDLKAYVPEDEWKPTHPNYFHTEAMLDYFESINGVGEGSLEHAERQIIKALDLVPNRTTYIELHHDIKNALNRLK